MRNTCLPCTKKTPKLTKIEISRLLSEVPEYQLEDINGIEIICKQYTFKNFDMALAFANKIGQIAQEQNHHPQIILEWGKVNLSWWTHSIGGLDTNDFVMAYKSEILYTSSKSTA